MQHACDASLGSLTHYVSTLRATGPRHFRFASNIAKHPSKSDERIKLLKSARKLLKTKTEEIVEEIGSAASAKSHDAEQNAWDLLLKEHLQPSSHIPTTDHQQSQSTNHPEPEPQQRCPHPFYQRRVVGLLSPEDAQLKDVSKPDQLKLPTLAHRLTRVLHNPGVHWVADPRVRKLNFVSYVQQVPAVEDFAFERISGFVPSSHDENLTRLAKAEDCTFAGSTSSLSGMLCQIYLLLSNAKKVNTSNLSMHFANEPKTFTPGQCMPVSVKLNYRDGVFAADSDSTHLGPTETILSQLGIVLEKFLTYSEPNFKQFLKSSTESLPKDYAPQKELYRYAKYDRFMMRAQLDCFNCTLPSPGVFDIKTRAAFPIRYDLENYRDNLDYTIRTNYGKSESFEKEYYDLIRSAFLKWSFQLRIGNMDGAFVAYHNIRKIFGFQYIPLSDIDDCLFGHTAGHRVFSKCIGLLNAIFKEISIYFPKTTMKCTWETSGQVMHVWVEPEWDSPLRDRPIVQLDVKLKHYLGSDEVSGSDAVGSTVGPWTVEYEITRSQNPKHLIWRRRQTAFNKQLAIYRYNTDPNERVERGLDIDGDAHGMDASLDPRKIDISANEPETLEHSDPDLIEPEQVDSNRRAWFDGHLRSISSSLMP